MGPEDEDEFMSFLLHRSTEKSNKKSINCLTYDWTFSRSNIFFFSQHTMYDTKV